MKLDEVLEPVDEASTPKRKTRVRNGKVQRRKKTCKKGEKLSGGRCERQSAQERRNRKMAAKKSAKKSQPQRKRSRRKSNRIRDRKNLN